MKQCEQRDQCLLVGRSSAGAAPAGPTRSPTREARRRATSRRTGRYRGVDQERDLLRARRVERRHTGDPPAGIALERRAEGHGELTEREPGGRAHQGVFFAGAAWS